MTRPSGVTQRNISSRAAAKRWLALTMIATVSGTLLVPSVRAQSTTVACILPPEVSGTKLQRLTLDLGQSMVCIEDRTASAAVAVFANDRDVAYEIPATRSGPSAYATPNGMVWEVTPSTLRVSDSVGMIFDALRVDGPAIP
ncbi:MAG: hypothetical protein AAFQ42_00990 [Pseudomonadota bacterium]